MPHSFVVVAILGIAGCLAESIVPDTLQQGGIRRDHGYNHVSVVDIPQRRRLDDRLLPIYMGSDNVNPNKLVSDIKIGSDNINPNKIGPDNLNPNKQVAFINPNNQVTNDVELTGKMTTVTPTLQPSDAPSKSPSISSNSSGLVLNDDDGISDSILMTITNDDGINDSLTTIVPVSSKANKLSANLTTIASKAEKFVTPNVSTYEDGEVINEEVATIITNETTFNQTIDITIPNNVSNHDDDGVTDEVTIITTTPTNDITTPMSNVSTAIYPSTRFKLYWYWGIDWSPTNDRFYCMECSGTDGCYVGNNVYHKQCNNGSVDQLFTVVGNTVRPTFDQSLCFTVMGYHRSIDTDGDPITTPIELQLCDENNSLQEFVGYKSSGEFELNPINRTDRCLVANHYPKSYEMVYPRDCINARIDHSSSYIAY